MPSYDADNLCPYYSWSGDYVAIGVERSWRCGRLIKVQSRIGKTSNALNDLILLRYTALHQSTRENEAGTCSVPIIRERSARKDYDRWSVYMYTLERTNERGKRITFHTGIYREISGICIMTIWKWNNGGVQSETEMTCTCSATYVLPTSPLLTRAHFWQLLAPGNFDFSFPKLFFFSRTDTQTQSEHIPVQSRSHNPPFVTSVEVPKISP